MYTVPYRNRLRDFVLQMASADTRVVSGAVVGSLALKQGDRWSDLDLTFGVQDGIPISAVLEDWTHDLVKEFEAITLFDLPSGPSIYRVFLLPGCLQFDLSFTPAADFGATGPTFKLLFGTSVVRPPTEPPSARELFGYAVHHALRARFCIERKRVWQAAYWINSLRDNALSLACLRLGLPARYGRGFDDLPPEVKNAFAESLVVTLEPGSLKRSLSWAIEGLLHEGAAVPDLAKQVEPRLRQLMPAALD